MPIELEISKFDPRILEKRRLNGHSPVILFVARRGSGKSTALVDILSYFNNDIPFVCMSGTEEVNGFYKKYIHEACIYYEFDKNVIENIMEKQKELGSEYERKGEDFKKHPEHGVGILLDDLSYDKAIMKNKCFSEIFKNGRHTNIITIIVFQYITDIHPSQRDNADYVFVSSQNKKDGVDKLYKYFFGMFDKVADFKKVLDKCTENYGMLVLDNNSRSNRIEDQVFWYRADVNKSFRVCEKMWPIWNKQLKKEEDEDIGKTFKRPLAESDIIVKMKPSKKLDMDFT